MSEAAVEKAKGLIQGVSFTRWIIRLLMIGISTVAMWLNHEYKDQIKRLTISNNQKDTLLNSCLEHRMQETINREERSYRELQELKAENRKIDSLVRNQFRITKLE